MWKQKCDEGGVGGGVRDELEHFFKWFQFSGRQEGVLVPHVVRCCVEEVERRGMDEVGIYRISGSAIDISKLKAAFNSSKTANNPADAIFVKISDIIVMRIVNEPQNQEVKRSNALKTEASRFILWRT